MNTRFKINNFKIFNTEGAEFELSPLTILTGCNSSGKSSVVKALTLLTDYLRKINSEIEYKGDFKIEECCIDFSSLQSQSMGGFKKVLNINCNNNNTILFAYSIVSDFLAEEITIELTYTSQESDELNRGWLSKISFKKSNGTIILEAHINNNKLNFSLINFNCIKSNFLNWALYSCKIRINESININKTFGAEFGENLDELISVSKKIDTQLSKANISNNSIKGYIRLYDNKKSIEGKCPISIWNSLQGSIETNSLLYLPLVNKLGKLSKADCVNYLINLIDSPSVNKIIKSIVNKIILDFDLSGYDSFAKYYIEKEENEGMIFGEDQLLISTFGRNKSLSFFKTISLFSIKTCDNILYKEITPDTLILKSGEEGLRKANKDDIIDSKLELANLISNLSFTSFYTALIELSIIDDNNSLKNIIQVTPIFPNDNTIGDKSHKLFSLMNKYLQAILFESLSPEHIVNTKYVSSNRIDVQRLYTFDNQSSDFTRLLNRYFNAKRVNLGNYVPNSFINKWINNFNIANSIEIKPTDDILGISIYLNKYNGEKTLLADEGYGISQLISVILEIETAILESKTYVSRLNNSIVMPITTLSDAEKCVEYHPQTIAIEEPEVHLHPRYQSMLAEMFIEAFKLYNIHFIVETHSEYLIRKLQTIVAKQDVNSNDISLHYIEKLGGLQLPTVKHIVIENDGRLSSPLGTGFFDEADNLAINLLEIKAGI